jgi:hypothetical protein
MSSALAQARETPLNVILSKAKDQVANDEGGKLLKTLHAP